VLGARLEAMHAARPGPSARRSSRTRSSSRATYTAHLAGTARMGDDPETSVCDADGRLHEVENV
jgi:choline dehydrogenase-like flavoprotein